MELVGFKADAPAHLFVIRRHPSSFYQTPPPPFLPANTANKGKGKDHTSEGRCRTRERQ